MLRLSSLPIRPPRPEDDDGDDELGCLTAIGEELEATDERDGPYAESEFQARTDFEVPAVSMAAVSFASIEEADERIDRYRDAIRGCESVQETDAEGVTTQLEIAVDDTPHLPLVDEALTVAAAGSIESGLEFPVLIEFAITRVDNNVVFFAFSDLVGDAGDATRTYSTALLERLVAVTNDETPSDDLITVPDPGDSEGLSSGS